MAMPSADGGRLPRARGSAWEEGVLALLEAHQQEESGLVAAYAELAEASEHPHVRYLGSMLLGDEIEHHRIIQELTKALLGDIEFRDIEGSVPRIQPVKDGGALLERAEQLLAFEREDLRALQGLAKRLRPVRKTTLWGLLVEMMELDTQKHIRILQFIVDESKHT